MITWIAHMIRSEGLGSAELEVSEQKIQIPGIPVEGFR